MRQEFSKRTRLEAWMVSGGKCRDCKLRIVGRPEYHHENEDTFGGSNLLDNCVVLCRRCHGIITGKRAAVIAKSTRVRNKHIGIKRRSSFQTNRDGIWKKKMDGSVVRR